MEVRCWVTKGSGKFFTLVENFGQYPKKLGNH